MKDKGKHKQVVEENSAEWRKSLNLKKLKSAKLKLKISQKKKKKWTKKISEHFTGFDRFRKQLYSFSTTEKNDHISDIISKSTNCWNIRSRSQKELNDLIWKLLK